MMATTSPRSIPTETPLSTCVGPKLFVTLSISTSGIETPFEFFGGPGQREAEREIDQRHERIDEEGAEGGVVQHRAGLGDLDEADDGGERGALDHLHRKADGRRNRDTH